MRTTQRDRAPCPVRVPPLVPFGPSRPFLHRDPAVRIIGKGALRIAPCIIFGILHILNIDITRIL